MLLSICVPCHNRVHDLVNTLPFMLMAVHTSPPAEIVVLDYNSPDRLEDYICSRHESCITYRKYTGRSYYHMAHARNLSVLAASGEYIVIMSADIYPKPEFFPTVRDLLQDRTITWMRGSKYHGVIVCRRSEFIDAGGYDERLEFYGPEDRELEERLLRRGGKFVEMPNMIGLIPTPNEEKVKNYRLALPKEEMSRRGHEILEENRDAQITVANPGGWGSWN